MVDQEEYKCLERALALIKMGKARQAVEVLEKGLADFPYSEWIMAELSHAYFLNKQKKESEQTAIQCLILSPKNPYAWQWMAFNQWDKGDKESAVESIKKALEAEPENAGFLNVYGQILLSKKDLEEAGKVFEKLLAKDPKDVDALCGLAVVKADTGQPKEAVELANKAVELEPQNEKVHQTLGFIHLSKSDHKKAMEHLHQALKLDPASSTGKAIAQRWIPTAKLQRLGLYSAGAIVALAVLGYLVNSEVLVWLIMLLFLAMTLAVAGIYYLEWKSKKA